MSIPIVKNPLSAKHKAVGNPILPIPTTPIVKLFVDIFCNR